MITKNWEMCLNRKLKLKKVNVKKFLMVVSIALIIINNAFAGICSGIGQIENAVGSAFTDAIMSDITNQFNNNHTTEEFYVEKNELINDSYEFDHTDMNGNDISNCEIMINRPIVKGKDDTEVAKVNELIGKLINEYIEDIKNDDSVIVVKGYKQWDGSFIETYNYAIEYIQLLDTQEFMNVDYTWLGSKDKIWGFTINGKYKLSYQDFETDCAITFIYNKKDKTATLEGGTGGNFGMKKFVIDKLNRKHIAN